jgi:chemotaxis signal transduction protein
VVVDEVHEVTVVAFERCERPPRGTDHLEAVVRIDGRLLMIIDLPALLGAQPSRAPG